MKKKRVAFYVDGFNLYHAINELNYERVYDSITGKTRRGKYVGDKHYLKWVCLKQMAQSLIRSGSEDVNSVVYFSALPIDKPNSLDRHMRYRDALTESGVECVMGHYRMRPCTCKNCHTEYMAPEEKETDVNVGLRIISDAYKNRFDVCYLVSTDTDFLPLIRMMKTDFPSKEFVTVATPNRTYPNDFKKLVARKTKVTPSILETCLMAEKVGSIVRPENYKPGIIIPRAMK